MSDGKPRDRDGHYPEDLLQVRATCLTVAATLGAYLEGLCIVGGLVPNLLIDQRHTGSCEVHSRRRLSAQVERRSEITFEQVPVDLKRERRRVVALVSVRR